MSQSEFGSRNESTPFDPPIICIHGVSVEDRCPDCWGTEDESGDLYVDTCEHGVPWCDECEQCEESEDENE